MIDLNELLVLIRKLKGIEINIKYNIAELPEKITLKLTDEKEED